MAHRDDKAALRETNATTAAPIASEISMTLNSAGQLVRAVGRLAESRIRERRSQATAAAVDLV